MMAEHGGDSCEQRCIEAIDAQAKTDPTFAVALTFTKAVLSDDVEKLRVVLEQAPTAYIWQPRNHTTPLHIGEDHRLHVVDTILNYALMHKAEKCAALMLEHAKCTDEEYTTLRVGHQLWEALQIATRLSLTTALPVILNHTEFPLPTKSGDENRAVLLACFSGRGDNAMKPFIDKLCNPIARDGSTIVHWLCAAGNGVALKMALEHDVYLQHINRTDVESKLNAPIFVAIKSHSMDCVNALLALPTLDVNMDGADEEGSPLAYAISVDCASAALALVKNRRTLINVSCVRPSSSDTECTSVGHDRDEPAVIQVIAKAKNDLPKWSELLSAFVRHPKLDINAADAERVSLLMHIVTLPTETNDILDIVLAHRKLKATTKTLNGGSTVLHCACFSVNAYAIKQLLRIKSVAALINVADLGGFTPVHLLCLALYKSVDEQTYSNFSQSFTELFAVPNMPVNHVFIDGGTSMTMLCSLLKHYEHMGECVRQLMRHPKLDVNNRDKAGNTPLHVMCTDGDHLEAVKLLLAHKDCDVNALNDNGHSAITLAILNDSYDVVNVLVANPDVDLSLCGRRDGAIGPLVVAMRMFSNHVLTTLLQQEHRLTLDLEQLRVQLGVANKFIGHVRNAGLCVMREVKPHSIWELVPVFDNCHLDMLEQLLKCEPLRRQVDNQSEELPWTALMAAANKGDYALVELLLTVGRANPTLKNEKGRTAREMCKEDKVGRRVGRLLKHYEEYWNRPTVRHLGWVGRRLRVSYKRSSSPIKPFEDHPEDDE